MKRILYAICLCCCTGMVQQSKAQSAKLYSSAGLLKGTYSKIADALAASVDRDSILLSPNTFYEYDLISSGSKYIILQGSIVGADTSTINANKKGFCIKGFKGTIRDMVITGAYPVLNISGVYSGTAIFGFQGLIAGKTTIRDNVSSLGSIIHYSNSTTFEGDIKILNNIVYYYSNPLLGTILSLGEYYAGIKIELRGNLLIANNKSNDVGGIQFLGGPKGGDTTKLKANKNFILTGNLRIENNEGRRTGGIMIQDGCYVDLSGVTIINNRATEPGWGGAIVVDSGSNSSSTIYDSIGVPLVRIRNSRIYNPLPDGSRQLEVRLMSRRGIKAKPCYFYTDACWWGSNDTSGLFKMDSGTLFKVSNWAVSHWFAKPFGTAGSNVRAQLKLNTGAALPDSSLRSIEAKYFATAGYFMPTVAKINASNVVSSDYYYPSTGSYSVMAVIDADTFRPSKEALSIKERGFEQVTIYPNPVREVLTIQGVEKGSSIELIDLNGRIVKGFVSMEVAKQELNTSGLPKGQYLLKIVNRAGAIGVVKLQKE